MEVGESSRKEVSWIPTTPLKPILPRTVPICGAGEGNQLNRANFLNTSLGVSSHDCYGNRVAACVESSSGEGMNMKPQEQGESAARLTSNGSDSARTCVRPSFDAVSSKENISFADLLALADAVYVHSTTIHAGSNIGVKNPFVPISRSQSEPLSNPTSTLLSHQNVCLQQTPIIFINDKPGEPQGTYTGCCMKTISQLAPSTPDKAIGRESTLVAGMQINVVQDKNVPDTMLDNDRTPNKKGLSEPVIESSVAAVSTSLKEKHNPSKDGSHGFDQPPLPIQRRRKHRPKVIKEGKSKGTRKPVTPKSVQSKENQTKRKYLRKKGVNKTSTTPPTEVTGEPTMPEPTKKSCTRSLNSEKGKAPRDEKLVPRENVTVDLDKGIDMVGEETQAAPSTYLPIISYLGADPNAYSKKNNKRKGWVTTLDGHEETERQSSQHDSNYSSGGNLTTGLHMGVTKRKHSASTEHVDTSCVNLIGVHYNELDAYQKMYSVQFPNVRKKQRSNKGLASNTSTTSLSPTKDVRFATYPQEDASIHLNASNSKCLISYEYKAGEVPVTFEAMDRAIHDKFQAFEGILSFCQSQTRPTKRRSRTPTRFRDFARLTTTRNFNILPSHFTKQLSYHGGTGKESIDIGSSQCSVLSSQVSGDFSIDQNPEKIASCSVRNSKVEDPSSIGEYKIFDNSTCFSKLFEMANSTKLYEVNSQRSKSPENEAPSSGFSNNKDGNDISAETSAVLTKKKPAKSLDSVHQVRGENMHIMGALAEKFRHLDIHTEVRDIASDRE